MLSLRHGFKLFARRSVMASEVRSPTMCNYFSDIFVVNLVRQLRRGIEIVLLLQVRPLRLFAVLLLRPLVRPQARRRR